MKAVVQRVSRAGVWERNSCRESVSVAVGATLPRGTLLGQIERGLLVLLGIGKGDTQADADWMIHKLLHLRIFPDDADKMNRSVTDFGGEILVVSQFTLYGDIRRGFRPSFTDAMPPAEAEKFYHEFMSKLRAATPGKVAEGRFAAMMEVELVNDGPVTIILESSVGQASCLSPPKVGQPSRLSMPSQTEGTGETPVPLFTSFDPASPVMKTDRHLPHWRQAGCTYFVTFRLADSLPQDKLRRWQSEREQWLRTHPEPWTDGQEAEHQQLFSGRIEFWLDAGYGNCCLRQPRVAQCVASALHQFDGERYALGEYVIMPNHVHALVTPLGDLEIESILHTWKSFTAHKINELLTRSGTVWQDESFDHIVRNEEALARCENYIRQNATLAGLRPGEFLCGKGKQ